MTATAELKPDQWLDDCAPLLRAIMDISQERRLDAVALVLRVCIDRGYLERGATLTARAARDAWIPKG